MQLQAKKILSISNAKQTKPVSFYETLVASSFDVHSRNGFKDPLSTNNLLYCLSTLLLRSYMFFCVRQYKLCRYIDSCNRTTRVRHIHSKKTRPVSWFTKPVELPDLMFAKFIKKSRQSGLALLTRQER